MRAKAYSVVLLIGMGVLIASWVSKGDAQTNSKEVTAHEYAVVLVNDEGEINLESGSAPLSVQGLIWALNKYPKEGWTVHSIVPYCSGSSSIINGSGSGGSYTSFVVVLSK